MTPEPRGYGLELARRAQTYGEPSIVTGRDASAGTHEVQIGAVLSDQYSDSIDGVKQLLLRVPEDVHRRLTARAAREGRSLNAVATEILDAAAEADRGDRRDQVRAAAAAAGTLRAVSARPVSAARRRRITESTRGLGPQVDRLLAHERERP